MILAEVADAAMLDSVLIIQSKLGFLKQRTRITLLQASNLGAPTERLMGWLAFCSARGTGWKFELLSGTSPTFSYDVSN